MPIVEIPPLPGQPKTVDVFAILEIAMRQRGGSRVRNGAYLWCEMQVNRTVKMSVELATELYKLGTTYRYYYRVMSTSPLERPGLSMEEWTRMKQEAEHLCRELDKIYPGR